MLQALHEAEKAYEADEVPVGAVVVYEDRIIGRGYNQREQLNDPTAHAEIIAITAAANTLEDWRLNNCTLFVTKEPCPMCAGAIVNARLKMVIFGCYDEEAGCCGSLYQLCGDPRFKTKVSVKGGVLEK
ncbi:MAG: nucleoside deaminase, partial [Candidatus Marinimicrobia bacterium]|nr:nucleoside deaminase [Candidatus Neomarinimicrobiota bacterium]